MERFTMKKILRFGAVYITCPIFDEDSLCYRTPSELSISDLLRSQIKEWDLEYQKTFCEDYPPDSKFETLEDLERHNARGLVLAEQLQKELGDQYEIQFWPVQ